MWIDGWWMVDGGLWITVDYSGLQWIVEGRGVSRHAPKQY